MRIDDATSLHYDTLVYGLGSVADTETVPGVEEFAYTLNSAQDAILLADTARSARPRHGRGRRQRADRRRVGGGDRRTASRTSTSCCWAGRSPDAMMRKAARARLHGGLQRLGVRVRSGVDIVKVMSDGVELGDGEVHRRRGGPVDQRYAGLADGRGRRVGPSTSAAASSPTTRCGRSRTQSVYAVGDAAAIRQGYGVMHGTCQSGMPTGVHAAISIARALKGKQPKPFRFGYYHTPVSLGRHDAVIQFTHADDSPRSVLLDRPAGGRGIRRR